MGIAKQAATLRAARNSASIRTYHPDGTVKCDGERLFRSQAARDVGCILDVNPSVAAWLCMPSPLGAVGIAHVPDFQVFDEDGATMYLDAPDRAVSVDIAVIASEAARIGYRYRLLDRAEIYDGFRLRNAKDLLRYAAHVTPLGDRLRLLAALDEHGSLPLAECLKAFQETRSVPGIASLILHGYVEVDLDDAPLGPETAVRRIPR
ncbi:MULTISPECIES: hypothetical protein [Agrobacterium]|uniref:TnsA endonuclease N-terminal domain-containing protein n=1 Tax=Agrobacterium tumefaciens TaxID=358 RepID=A0AAE6BA51_AGRTU|nr:MULTISPECIES: hypothetical protein [Agrobacterium]QCL72265.1 hypothetical protein CFBP5499_01655 [Agrobacterium tumefaciens]QCL77836.1 hypothetical protein CFBP5877_01205 [Agrobacterium tumefaciens]CUX21766.1 conserved hypothetical protein [Agrobacterium sp. NCPPB 925]